MSTSTQRATAPAIDEAKLNDFMGQAVVDMGMNHEHQVDQARAYLQDPYRED